jgi:hypothetical protein
VIIAYPDLIIFIILAQQIVQEPGEMNFLVPGGYQDGNHLRSSVQFPGAPEVKACIDQDHQDPDTQKDKGCDGQ